MVKIIDPVNLLNDQADYQNTCAAYGMEVIVPRTRAHARAIQKFNGGKYPNIVNVFPKFDGATGLQNWQGMCKGVPCSFYLSNSNNGCINPSIEPSGNNTTTNSLYLWTETGDWGCWDDSNNWVDNAYAGWVICSPNDNPEPSNLPGCLDYAVNHRVWNKSVDGISGEYAIVLDGTSMTAYCDQNTDGGGWTLVLNYLHDANTNPQLSVKTDFLPLKGSDTLGDDESANSVIWGHAGNSLFSDLNTAEVRFYGRTGNHTRVIDFSTSDSSCIEYLETGTGNCQNAKLKYHGLISQNAYLPGLIDNSYVDQGDYALTNFTFYNTSNYHWGIKAGGGNNRWEVDDFANDDGENTLHRVFVRSYPVHKDCLEILNSRKNRGSGFYAIDPDGTGGKSPWITYCDMETKGGGWTLVAIYGYGYGRPAIYLENSYPRPGASYYHTPTYGFTIDINVLRATANNGNIMNFSVDASLIWENSNYEVMGYVGGVTDDYITATLPGGCNYFAGDSWCVEDSYGPFNVYTSDGTIITANGYACTTAHGNPPFAGDPYNGFGLHIIDGYDNKFYGNYHCCTTDSLEGSQNMGRLFTSFNSSDGTFWDSGVISYWDNAGALYQPGALFIR
jgi:Fibrinogen beta and gamma chains, C-terminal globular domain